MQDKEICISRQIVFLLLLTGTLNGLPLYFSSYNYPHDDTKWTLDTIVRSTIRATLHRVGPYRDISNKYQHINIVIYADTYCRCHDMVPLDITTRAVSRIHLIWSRRDHTLSLETAAEIINSHSVIHFLILQALMF